METSEPTRTFVLDAGGRYGIHPTWKKFGGDLRYFLFEPDGAEATRLRSKYSKRPDVVVVDSALHDRPTSVKIHVLSHKGMSSLYRPNLDSEWFKSRQSERDIQEEVTVQAITVDDYCSKQGIALDFIKIDTEGNEYNILKGADRQLRNSVLGLRCETYFDAVFEGVVLFPKLHELMLEAGFFLVNMDYNGRGVCRNGYVQYDGRYGVLTGCDAVYLKRTPWILNGEARDDKSVGSRALKCAAFCLANSASDVAFDILLEARKHHPGALAACASSKLYRYVAIRVQTHIKNIIYQPSQNVEELRNVYRNLFGDELKDMHKFFESTETNPD